jgi:hypothetical protein
MKVPRTTRIREPSKRHVRLLVSLLAMVLVDDAVHILDSFVSVHSANVLIATTHILLLHNEFSWTKTLFDLSGCLWAPYGRVRNSLNSPSSKRKTKTPWLISAVLVVSLTVARIFLFPDPPSLVLRHCNELEATTSICPRGNPQACPVGSDFSLFVTARRPRKLRTFRHVT